MLAQNSKIYAETTYSSSYTDIGCHMLKVRSTSTKILATYQAQENTRSAISFIIIHPLLLICHGDRWLPDFKKKFSIPVLSITNRIFLVYDPLLDCHQREHQCYQHHFIPQAHNHFIHYMRVQVKTSVIVTIISTSRLLCTVAQRVQVKTSVIVKIISNSRMLCTVLQCTEYKLKHL